MESKVLAIDFDGVVHDFKNPIVGRKMGGPIEGTKEALLSFRRKGYRIIIHSVGAAQTKWIIDFMKYYNLPFDEVTNVKPNATWYIDDKAIRFTTWNEVVKQI